MGAVVDWATPIIVRNEDVIQAVKIDEATFNAVCDAELCEIDNGDNNIWVPAIMSRSPAIPQS